MLLLGIRPPAWQGYSSPRLLQGGEGFVENEPLGTPPRALLEVSFLSLEVLCVCVCVRARTHLGGCHSISLFLCPGPGRGEGALSSALNTCGCFRCHQNERVCVGRPGPLELEGEEELLQRDFLREQWPHPSARWQSPVWARVGAAPRGTFLRPES